MQGLWNCLGLFQVIMANIGKPPKKLVNQISAHQLDPTDAARMWGTQLRLVMSILCRHVPSVGWWSLGANVAGCDWIHVCWICVYYILYMYMNVWLWCHRIICYDIISFHYCMSYMMQCFAWWHSWCFASVSISLKMWKLEFLSIPCFTSRFCKQFPTPKQAKRWKLKNKRLKVERSLKILLWRPLNHQFSNIWPITISPHPSSTQVANLQQLHPILHLGRVSW